MLWKPVRRRKERLLDLGESTREIVTSVHESVGLFLRLIVYLKEVGASMECFPTYCTMYIVQIRDLEKWLVTSGPFICIAYTVGHEFLQSWSILPSIRHASLDGGDMLSICIDRQS